MLTNFCVIHCAVHFASLVFYINDDEKVTLPVQAMKAYCGSGDVPPLIFNLGTRL